MTTPEWKGLFEWSMKYHDGTRPSEMSAQDVDPEKMKWLDNVLKNYMTDFNDRMKEITQVFEDGENSDASIAEKVALLDELQDIVESVDHAKNLHTIGGLSTLITILECPHAILRQKAAEVVSTCVQNNLPVQQWFRESGVLPPLMKLLTDENDMCRLRGWLAISSLIRNYPEGEKIFLSAGGSRLLLEAASSQNDKIRRRALSLMQYVLRGESRKSVLDSGGVEIAMGALDSGNSEVRQAALGALIEAAEDRDGNVKVRQAGGLLEKTTQIHKRLSDLPNNEKEMFLEEMEAAEKLIESLHQPSSSRSSQQQQKCTALSLA
ncbi:hypothetical protein BSKO_08229 [Bryopsis sp. KO-2023]|nr:hypothetical protein BSKO_08229 [Bryopsis sp. KO-2023]